MKKLLLLLFLTNCAKAQVVVVGDSISIDYAPFIKEATHIPDNARNTVYTLSHIDEWIPNNVDTILWNNGLWDCNLGFENWATTPKEYEDNIVKIANKLKPKTKKLYFVLTTEIPPGNIGPIGRITGCEVERNNIAIREMFKLNIEIIDLHSLSVLIRDKHISPLDVHFENDGSRTLGEFISKVIK